MTPLLLYQGLLGHVDGSSVLPAEFTDEGKSTPNPAFLAWVTADQRTVILLQSSLTEEAFSEVVGLSTARAIWVALERAFGNSSMERIQTLRDQLRHLTKGTLTVSEFGRRFKHICDQLSAIGQPVDDSDKTHWFLCGLGAAFETFSTAVRASRVPHVFRDLVSQAEGHEMFLQTLHGSSPPVAFSAQHAHTASTQPPHLLAPQSTQPGSFSAAGFRGRGGRATRGGRGRGRRPPQCQLCRTRGHYANVCPQLASFTKTSPASDTELARAFHAQCHVNSSAPDWYVDSGASDHMVSSSASVSNSTPSVGDASVLFGSTNEGSSSARNV